LKRVLLVLAVLMAVGLSAGAQEDYRITQTVTLPQTSYVGDRVEVRVSIRPSGAVSITEPESLPEAPWAEFHDLRVFPQGNEYELRVVLTPYQPGTLTLPAMDLGGIEVRELNLHVSSVLDGADTEPAPPHRQAVLPYTRIMVAGAAAVLLLVPFGAFAAARWGRKRLERILAGYRSGKPYRRILKALRALEGRIEELDPRSFYIELLHELRAYFSEKLDRDLMSATSSEIGSHLRRLISRAEDREELIQLFHSADLVKFASRSSRLGERREHLAVLRRVLETVEHDAQRGGGEESKEELRRVGA